MVTPLCRVVAALLLLAALVLGSPWARRVVAQDPPAGTADGPQGEGFAEESEEGASPALVVTPRPAATARRGIWQSGIGRGFRKGARQSGLVLGAGQGTQHFGSRYGHDLALTTAGFGRMLGPNWELRGELFGGQQVEPTDRALFGVTPLLRYNFATRSRWVPFADGGVGVSYTTIRDGDLSTDFQFNVQAGAGAHYFFREDQALTVQYRFFHLSNARVKLPNNAVNTHMLFAGVNWFF
jgi:opacity protein-like surface antigen